MATESEKDIAKIFRERTLIDEALNAAVREAVLAHKQKGLPLVVWRDGKIVWIPPEDLDVGETPAPTR
ncbi:MAG: hypothetical protein ACYC35_04600 [Pirellulales bacterium]